ncbi:hypothetical protein Lal_00033626 [Lupinus albus]|nr:hypothetical protein Lal_00033626 [Lupinus albus]
MRLFGISIEIPINGIFHRNSNFFFISMILNTKRREVHILPESSYIMRIKKRIELKIFSGNIFFPGEIDKISCHSGILIPPETGKQNSKE